MPAQSSRKARLNWRGREPDRSEARPCHASPPTRRASSARVSQIDRRLALATVTFRSYNLRMPTWGGPKRRENIRKHGYDFPGCERIFDGPAWVYEDKRLAYGELRLCAVGWLQGQVMHMTYTEREDDFHVISLREAEKYEVNRFFQEVPH